MPLSILKARTIMLNYRLFLSVIAKMDDLTLADPRAGQTSCKPRLFAEVALTIWGEVKRRRARPPRPLSFILFGTGRLHVVISQGGDRSNGVYRIRIPGI